MSVLFTNSAGVYLSGTLGTGVDPSSWRVFSAFIKVTAFGADNYLVLADSGGSYANGLLAASGGNMGAFQAASFPTTQARTSTGTYSTATWYHLAGWWEPVDTSSLMRPWVGGSAVNTAGGNVNMTGAGSLVDLTLGQSSDVRMAEVSLFEVASEAAAETLIAELTTTYANAVSAAGTLRGYWPLVNDANFDTAGVNLTNTGSAAFDSGADHPSLSGGGGGSTAQVIACII